MTCVDWLVKLTGLHLVSTTFSQRSAFTKSGIHSFDKDVIIDLSLKPSEVFLVDRESREERGVQESVNEECEIVVREPDCVRVDEEEVSKKQ